MKSRSLLAAVSLAVGGFLLSLQVKSADMAVLNGDLDRASRQLVMENSKLKYAVPKDKQAILGAYTLIDQLGSTPEFLSPDDSLTQTWRGLRLGYNAVPAQQNFGSDQFIRYGLAMQNATGKLSDYDYISVQSKLIQWQKKTLAPELLEADQKVVLTALPELREHYIQAGFNKLEANDVAMSAWYEIRAGSVALPSNRPMIVGDLLAFGGKMGLLTIESTPDRAAVTVNGSVWPDPTRASRYMPYGFVTIVLSKTGYKTHTLIQQVAKIKTEITATLIPETSKKP